MKLLALSLMILVFPAPTIPDIKAQTSDRALLTRRKSYSFSTAIALKLIESNGLLILRKECLKLPKVGDTYSSL